MGLSTLSTSDCSDFDENREKIEKRGDVFVKAGGLVLIFTLVSMGGNTNPMPGIQAAANIRHTIPTPILVISFSFHKKLGVASGNPLNEEKT